MHDHNLVESFPKHFILVEQRPVKDRAGAPVTGLHNVWITLNNPSELNSYTTDMIKEIILAVRAASNDRAAVAVVLTGAGSRAFCTGGNTREYAEVYAGHPGEYRQYMRLFNDMVTTVLQCDKPVICRVNGMRVGGGQEVGGALEVNLPVTGGVAAARGDAVHHPVEVRRQRAQGFGLGDIAGEGSNARRPQLGFGGGTAAQPEDGVSLPDQFHSQRQAHVTAANDQDAHGRRLIRRTRQRQYDHGLFKSLTGQG